LGAATALTLTISLATISAAVLAYQRFGRLLNPKTVMNVAMATMGMILVSPLMPVKGPWLLPKFFSLLVLYVVVLSLLREISLKKLLMCAVWQKQVV
jgi:hypothetical protein